MIVRKIVIYSLFIALFAGLIGSLAYRGFNNTRGEVECAITIPDTNRYDQYKQGDVGKCVELEIVSDQRSKNLGLAKYEQIPEDFGMLFDFDPPSPACIWMKDMNFSIDIVWLSPEDEIVKLERNVSPDTYPNTFCSDQPAKTVIELKEGVSVQARLGVGQTLDL